jgi:penicillin-binding protein 1A
LKNSNLYKELKKEYNKLQDSFSEMASKPKKMLVYDYKTLGEKEIEMSLLDSLRYTAMHLQNGVLAIDPRNGHVKAWVGGINHRHFKYDHVTARRSVGSTMKPFVYTAAMAFGGIQPCQEFEDIQYTIAPGDANFNVDKEWTPKNATEVFTGNRYNLYQGLVYSKNSITVRLVKEMGSVDLIRDLLDKVGISKIERLLGGRLAVPETPAICLGAVDISLLQMTGAYTTFANKGSYRKPIFVTHNQDKNGREIYRAEETVRPAINPLYNAVMVDMLKHVVGGQFNMGLKSENGGKTGTTNDFSDGWFMGVTPSLVVGVWTGGDDKWIRFTNLDDGQGYTTARPVFRKLMQKLEADASGIYDATLTFSPPPEGFSELVNCKKIKTQKPAFELKQLQKEQMKRDEFEETF